MEEWIGSHFRMPQEGESIILPDINGKFEVRGISLYNSKGQIAIPLCLVEKYKIEK